MYYEFRKIIKETNSRGWRFETDLDGRFYLSKFEELFNDNEIRVYVDIDDKGVHIIESVKIKSDGSISMVKENNKYLQKAIQLCAAYWEKNQKTYEVTK